MMEAAKDETLFFEGDPYFEGMLLACAKAQSSIDFETYIFKIDALGQRITEALIQAAERGVYVRAIVDGVGSPEWLGQIYPKLISAGVKAKIYHPPPWVLTYPQLKRSLFQRFLEYFNRIGRLNRRNHRKVCIIDRKSAWVGSFNIDQVHSQKHFGVKRWRDTGVQISGEAVEDLCLAFQRAWEEGPFQAPSHFILKKREKVALKEKKVRSSHHRNLRRFFYKDLLSRIKSAKKRIWITNAYFVPHHSYIRALVQAAKRGVDVRVIFPRHSDVIFIPWVTSVYYYTLLKEGIRLYEYLPRMLHAKSQLIDDWAIVGTSNLNYRSLLHDLEVDIVIEKNHALLEEQFLEDLKDSHEIRSVKDYKRPWYQRLLGRLFFIFRIWF